MSQEPVVLMGTDGAALASARAAFQQQGRRAALMVGDPADEAVTAAAASMAGELFGSGASVISLSEGRDHDHGADTASRK